MTFTLAMFLVATAGVVYSYLLYPLLLLVTPHQRELSSAESRDWPSLTLIITAYNEASRIREKLDNALAVEYRGDLHIVVASDCSSDATDALVLEYADRGVRLVRAGERRGKEHAQQCAISDSTSELLVFSDVATEIPADALTRMACWFSDPEIGAVSSEDRFVTADGGMAGEGLYVRYEMWLRRLESERAGLVGLSGSFFAARRVVCERDWYAPSDFSTALNCNALGMVAISAPDVLGYYRDLKDPVREYDRKVRTVVRGLSGLFHRPEVLFPNRGWFAFQIWSHKILRWLVPWCMVASLGLNMALAGHHVIFSMLLGAHLGVYSLALLVHVVPKLRQLGPLRIVYFFFQVNIAIAHATLLWLAGRRMGVWEPSAR